MTIKELNAITESTQAISIINGHAEEIKLNREDSVSLAAFGDFEIQSLQFWENKVEIEIKMIPVKHNS